MKNLHLYAISILISYWMFSGMDIVSIWTFVVPVIITKVFIWADKVEAE